MCYESWFKEKQMMETEEKARKEAEEAIKRAKLAGRPKRPSESGAQPVVEREEIPT